MFSLDREFWLCFPDELYALPAVALIFVVNYLFSRWEERWGAC